MTINLVSKYIILALTFAIIQGPAHSFELELGLDEQSPLLLLTESDWLKLKTSARDTLNNNADHQSSFWVNESTGNSGTIIVLNTDLSDVQPCRNTKFFIEVDKKASSTTVNLCKTEDDKWVEIGPRSTTMVDDRLIVPSTNSSMMVSPSQETPSVNNQKVLSQTSEECNKMAENIKQLNGNPLRRSAAMELYQAECQR
jgi:hypothetical protein